MKTIGLIGGMSWESSAEYYRVINQIVRSRLGGQHSARSLMYSVDFHDIERLMRDGRWEEVAAEMVGGALRLQNGGADFLVLCTNTMHKAVPAIEAVVGIPLLHIADATGDRVVQGGISSVGLLGTRYTMEDDFYRGRLEGKYGLEVLTPNAEDRTVIHDVIFDELCLGIVKAESRNAYLRIMESLARRGAGGIILGCTEIGLLVKAEDSPTPVFDTARIHAETAVDFALDD